MARWERWTFNGLSLVVAMSGLAYFYMKYAAQADDPFAVINHPWQPSMLALHVVAAPCLVLVFGIVLRSHVIKKLLSASRPNRRSGWMSLISFAVMALSGYLLQVMTTGLGVMVVVHIVSSLVFVLGYGAHLVIGWRVQAKVGDRAVARPPLSGASLLR